MDSPRSPRRPALLGPAALATFAGGNDPAQLAEVAHATAVAVVTAGRAAEDPAATDRLVRLMDDVGIDTVAELWADRPARSLPGAIEATCDYEAGQHLAQVARVVAGAGEPSTPEALRELLDAILGGVFRGDLAVALERAGAFARVVATGRARRADELEAADSVAASSLTQRAAAMQRTAEDLDAAAALWRTADLV
jgi:hypothetical protein